MKSKKKPGMMSGMKESGKWPPQPGVRGGKKGGMKKRGKRGM